ncbi:MAG: MFS transporter [Gammaproteobacteria bacterium]|nr:MAG: MFS transporter [Gammaproteobacteria bacterium]
MIKPHEFRSVVYYLSLFALMGIGLALGRGTADALFFKRFGIDYLPAMYVLTSFTLAVVCFFYAAFADRIAAERFFKYLFGILLVLLIFARILMHYPDLSWTYPYYYLVYEIASELLLVHGSLYLSQNLDALQSKRLMPLILGGSQVGIILGGLILAILSPLIGVSNVVLAWAFVTLVAIIMIVIRHQKQGVSPFFRSGRKRKPGLSDAITEVMHGLKFMKTSALLRAASFSLFFMVIMFYVLIYSVNRIYTDTFQTEEALSSFFGVLTAVNSTVALLFQFLIVNRLLKRFGVKSVNLYFPVTSIFSYLTLLVSFTLPSALLGSFNKDAVMTAFRNPVWNLMMNALPANIQGRARAMTVAVVIPLALLFAGIFLIAVQAFDEPAYFVVIGLISAAFYFHYNQRMNKAYVLEIVSHLKQKLTLPKDEMEKSLRGSDESVLEEISRGVRHSDEQISLAFSRSLVHSFPDKATEIILERLPTANEALKDQLINLLIPLRSPLLKNYLSKELDGANDRMKATLYRGLIILGDDTTRNVTSDFLNHENPRLQAIGILSIYRHEITDLLSQANEVWRSMLVSENIHANIAGLELLEIADEIKLLPEVDDASLRQAIQHLLSETDMRMRKTSLRMLQFVAESEQDWLYRTLHQLSESENVEIRLACVNSSKALSDKSANKIIERALEDPHPDVRDAAARLLSERNADDPQALISRLIEFNQGSPRSQAAILSQLMQMDTSPDVFSAIAEIKAEEAGQVAAASRMVKSHYEYGKSASITVLGMALNERLEAIVDLTLQAMQVQENADVIGAIRLGIRSGDIRYRASGLEALHSLENTSVARPLASILDSGDKQKNIVFENIRQAIDWCKGRNDPWLYQCANLAAES